MHPVLIAVQAAMFDHLAEGRFILGRHTCEKCGKRRATGVHHLT
jgi:hypothetical protein